ncbi:DUF2846 domain-containing protein [Cerasicoccus arenae]|uniref:DUF2846 domain-containing protein n=1 Tax=Cerasicoccus arenae TaxID=424488 RepID=UPI0016766362|nr:DUF2846 domain-containing protein [Cerasicoccus arenae]
MLKNFWACLAHRKLSRNDGVSQYMNYIWVALFAVLLSGCPNPKTVKGLNMPIAEAGQAQLVILRPYMMQGQLSGTPLYLDGEEIGQIAHDSYMYVNISPGRHQMDIESPLRIEWLDGAFEYEPLVINALPGKTYYYEMAWKTRTVRMDYPAYGMAMDDAYGMDWKLLTDEEAKEKLEGRTNSPTFDQYEQLKASGQIEFEHKARAR